MAAQVIKLMGETPVDMILAFPEGKMITGNRMMFSTVDDRVLYLPAAAGQEVQAKLRDLRIQAGDRVLIRQAISYASGEKRVEWEVYRAGAPVGQQSSGAFIVPKQPGAEGGPADPAPGPLPRAKSLSYEHTGARLHLQERTHMLIDVYAAAVAYAKRYPEVSREDVRTLLLAELARKPA